LPYIQHADIIQVSAHRKSHFSQAILSRQLRLNSCSFAYLGCGFSARVGAYQAGVLACVAELGAASTVAVCAAGMSMATKTTLVVITARAYASQP
jgi:hypothetical protein